MNLPSGPNRLRVKDAQIGQKQIEERPKARSVNARRIQGRGTEPGLLVAELGVSGDGVDQDDYVANAGAKGFEAPPAMRADQVEIKGVRLPSLKFPRNPTD